ncbi:hypothetical protein TSAR_009994 [Trichomalopsis sarcophagae]|uniref:Uncharacterized protein n=1 Tax=Trichomalopsis sarcophagae TaxID=543379 RepID=A0A232FBX7_9HYME|nr:hypothetical protein TSAR_009994 [Trichomalopsis sarcophagae]
MSPSQIEGRQENYDKRTRKDKEVVSVVGTSKIQSQESSEENADPPCQEVITRKMKKIEKKRKKNIHEGAAAKNKNDTRKPRERPTRPAALVLKAAEGNSVKKMRKTVARGLLLELRCTKEVKTKELQEAVKAVLVDEATIKRLQNEVVFEIKDLETRHESRQ